MNATAPAAPPSAPARKPERKIRHPFLVLVWVAAALAVLLTLVGVPGPIAVGIGLAVPAAIIAYGFSKSRTYRRPVLREVPADDPGIPAEVRRIFAAATRELEALGFEGMTVFRSERGAICVLLAGHPVHLDTAQVRCSLKSGQPARTVVNFATRLAAGARKLTYGGGEVPVWRLPATVDALRLPRTTEIYHVYAVHRWRLRSAGAPTVPAVGFLERLAAAHEEVEADGLARGTWRRRADGTLRPTAKGTVILLAGMLAAPVVDWRDRRREERILVKVATDPAR